MNKVLMFIKINLSFGIGVFISDRLGSVNPLAIGALCAATFVGMCLQDDRDVLREAFEKASKDATKTSEGK